MALPLDVHAVDGEADVEACTIVDCTAYTVGQADIDEENTVMDVKIVIQSCRKNNTHIVSWPSSHRSA
jgi:hypothetical protein